MMDRAIPQVVAVALVTGTGTIGLTKDLRRHLSRASGEVYLDLGAEVLLSASRTPRAIPAAVSGTRLVLPGEVVERLGLAKGSFLALIERGADLALKRMEIVRQEGFHATLTDLEWPSRIVRAVGMVPPPDRLLPMLQSHCETQRLRRDVRGFLQRRTTLEAWSARRLLGIPHGDDAALREQLIQERTGSQEPDGSWARDLIRTAGCLRELRELGLTRDDSTVARGAQWLLQRPESPWNPGMFFLRDALVAEQERIVDDKARTGQGRFRQLKTREKRQVEAGDPLIAQPCGPRIMWPTALALEALLEVGYEHEPRIQRALDLLCRGGWCECGYAHGASRWRRQHPTMVDEIEDVRRSYRAEFSWAGHQSLEDLARQPGERISREGGEGADRFRLKLNTHVQGCEVITMRALGQASGHPVRGLAEAYLWRVAGRQTGEDGSFPTEKYGYCRNSLASLLDVFSRFDSPVAHVVLLRAIPWIVGAQNPDGSWGHDANRDAMTLAVIRALIHSRDCLPAGLMP